MRIAMAQINAIVGDLEGNTRKICEAIEAAAEKGADLIAFPELALTGYPPEDLLLKPDFVAANREALLEVARRTPAVSVVVGFVDADDHLYQAAAALCVGRGSGGAWLCGRVPGGAYPPPRGANGVRASGAPLKEDIATPPIPVAARRH